MGAKTEVDTIAFGNHVRVLNDLSSIVEQALGGGQAIASDLGIPDLENQPTGFGLEKLQEELLGVADIVGTLNDNLLSPDNLEVLSENSGLVFSQLELLKEVGVMAQLVAADMGKVVGGLGADATMVAGRYRHSDMADQRAASVALVSILKTLQDFPDALLAVAQSLHIVMPPFLSGVMTDDVRAKGGSLLNLTGVGVLFDVIADKGGLTSQLVAFDDFLNGQRGEPGILQEMTQRADRVGTDLVTFSGLVAAQIDLLSRQKGVTPGEIRQLKRLTRNLPQVDGASQKAPPDLSLMLEDVAVQVSSDEAKSLISSAQSVVGTLGGLLSTWMDVAPAEVDASGGASVGASIKAGLTVLSASDTTKAIFSTVFYIVDLIFTLVLNGLDHIEDVVAKITVLLDTIADRQTV